jgi:hypothetical protein
MGFNVLGWTDAQLFFEQLQHQYGKSFGGYGYMLILFELIDVISGFDFHS